MEALSQLGSLTSLSLHTTMNITPLVHHGSECSDHSDFDRNALKHVLGVFNKIFWTKTKRQQYNVFLFEPDQMNQTAGAKQPRIKYWKMNIIVWMYSLWKDNNLYEGYEAEY